MSDGPNVTAYRNIHEAMGEPPREWDRDRSGGGNWKRDTYVRPTLNRFDETRRMVSGIAGPDRFHRLVTECDQMVPGIVLAPAVARFRSLLAALFEPEHPSYITLDSFPAGVCVNGKWCDWPGLVVDALDDGWKVELDDSGQSHGGSHRYRRGDPPVERIVEIVRCWIRQQDTHFDRLGEQHLGPIRDGRAERGLP